MHISFILSSGVCPPLFLQKFDCNSASLSKISNVFLHMVIFFNDFDILQVRKLLASKIKSNIWKYMYGLYVVRNI